MTGPAEITRAVHNALAREDRERLRAERAAEIAERHERQLRLEPLHAFHRKMATTHRRVQRQHLAAAAMHAAHAARLQTWADTPGRHTALPRFMASVAEAAGADAAAVTLFGPGLVETLAAASDDIAKAAQDAEFTFGEGPARDAVTGRWTVRAATGALCRRWPTYGPAIDRLGIHSVAAVPITPTGGEPIGALTLFGLDPLDPTAGDDDAPGLHAIADTVAIMLLHDDEATRATHDPIRGPLLSEADRRPVVHQATGVVSVQVGCSIPDALALIRARAFAEDRPLESVAADIVARTLRLA